MAVIIQFTKTIAVTGTAVQLVAGTTLNNYFVCSMVAQVRRANAASAYIGNAGVKKDGTAGVELAVPAAAVTPDSFAISSSDGSNSIDLRDWYGNGDNPDGFNVIAIQR